MTDRDALVERFWSKVEKGPDCWLWRGSRSGGGQGQFRVGRSMERAHRVAWVLTFGSLPPRQLRSMCGNLDCVRPDHRLPANRQQGPRNLARGAAQRFEAMVAKSLGCWLWTGAMTRLGYGQFSVSSAEGRPRMVSAHRFAWEEVHGRIPVGDDVFHLCDNRNCVRPDHLTIQRPEETSRRPRDREVEVLQAWVRNGMRYGSLKRAAGDLGIAYQTAKLHMWRLRKRISVTTSREAVDWLDKHEPAWRPMRSERHGDA